MYRHHDADTESDSHQSKQCTARLPNQVPDDVAMEKQAETLHASSRPSFMRRVRAAKAAASAL